jgi:hypothetical protein
MTPAGRKSPTGYVFAGLSAIVLGIAFLLAYEAVALVTGAFPPITWEVARAQGQHFYLISGIGMLVMYGLGALTGHFFWSQEIPPWFRLYRRPARALGLRVGPGPR